ncbi:DUF4825 domain-containing protein [Paenibacillus sp. J2TS4]|uniref:DUF4825 domain-containing protein n=1 Tax=Paenibacillus sp. J2TS4 TaxID=2807194 RepID=UPI001B0048B5|nr:DUF4825 domain-containing protein [Paenibacillus sp. J2TS4]GIP34484.1 hypothetical protein J2TS4_36940 [Paenibacillus sp. J2TS4]
MSEGRKFLSRLKSRVSFTQIMNANFNKRTVLIVGLLVVALVLLAVVKGTGLFQNASNEQQKQADQQDPLTHHFEDVLKYKNQYMGNASNLSNLFNNLPLNHVGMTFELLPDTLAAEINYNGVVSDIGSTLVQRSLIYNATAAFALIDNLEEIHANFIGEAYQIKREDIETWYGVNVSTLADTEVWVKTVQSRLANDEYVFDSAAAIIKKK